MSTAQILAELPRLSPSDRREVARLLAVLGEEAPALAADSPGPAFPRRDPATMPHVAFDSTTSISEERNAR